MVEDRETLVPVVVSGFSNNLKSSSYGLLALRPQVTILHLSKFMLTMYLQLMLGRTGLGAIGVGGAGEGGWGCCAVVCVTKTGYMIS